MSLGLLIAVSLVLGLAAWLFFMWTVRSGQYEDPEGPKYRMLDDDEPAPPATRSHSSHREDAAGEPGGGAPRRGA